jgi:glycosyltransferase involved in cell wall biosynthesis
MRLKHNKSEYVINDKSSMNYARNRWRCTVKVTIVAQNNPFIAEPSGTSAYIAGLIDTLRGKGLDITLISAEIGDGYKQEYNFQYIPIKMKRASSIGYLFKLMVKAPFLKLPKKSVIHGHRPDFMLPFVLFSRKSPKVCTLHGIPDIGIKTRKSPVTWRIYNIIERITIKRMDRLIAVNSSTKEYYLKKRRSLEDRISVIPVAIDNKMFKPMSTNKIRKKFGFNEDDKIILYIGRFSVEKGLDLLLGAFKELKAEIPRAKLVMVGKGPEESKIRNTSKIQNIKDISILKPVKHDKIPEIINCADVLTLCSMYEGMPTVVLEAMACGVPVVSTNVGDVKKVVIDGMTGQLIRKRNPEGVKDAILKVLNNKREDYIESCVDMANHYSWENISQKIVEVYKEVEKNI